MGCAILKGRGFHLISHSGTSLLEHSRAVKQTILDWGGDKQTAEAGLLHSLYGTVTNKLFEPPEIVEYQMYSELAGEDVNSLVLTYACFDRESLINNISRFHNFNSWNLRPQFDLAQTMKDRFRDTEVERICIIMLANTFDILQRGDASLAGRSKEDFDLLCSTLSKSRMVSLPPSELRKVNDA